MATIQIRRRTPSTKGKCRLVNYSIKEITMANDRHDEDKMVVIHIDHKQYKTTKGVKSPAEIRAIAQPPISEEYDLWIEVPLVRATTIK